MYHKDGENRRCIKTKTGCFKMRTMWKGAISFGLVNVPVKLYTATESKSIKFRQLHKECMNPIKYEKVCPVCNKELEDNEIVRGYEFEKGRFVVVDDKDLERIPEETAKTIDILDFVNLEEIDPIFFDRSYYLSPDETGSKAYALLRRAMEETGKIAIARVIIRSKQNLACIRVYDKNYLVMETMFYPDEVRSTAGLPSLPDPKLHENEIKMAVQLIGSLSEKFDPGKYTDEYREALLELIHGKIRGEEVKVPGYTGEGKVVNLMEALKASLEAANKSRMVSEEKKKGRLENSKGTEKAEKGGSGKKTAQKKTVKKTG